MTGLPTGEAARQVRPAIEVVARHPHTLLAILLAFGSGLLLWLPVPVPFGWVVVLGSIVILPGVGLARLLGIAGSWPMAALLGIPLALGYQFPAFALAALTHWDASTWGVGAILLGLAPALIATSRRSEEIGPWRPTRTVAAGLLVLLAVGALAVAMSGRDSDDWAYAGDLADYAADYPLAAFDSALGRDIPMIPRQRLDLWVATLAMGSRVTAASVPAFLQDQLPPVLAVAALSATFVLGASIGRRAAWGAVAVAVQLVWFMSSAAWPIQGDAFLTRLGQDKVVAWALLLPLIFAPLLHGSTWATSRRALAFGLLAGLGIAAVHPVTHLMLLATLGLWALLSTVFDRRSAATQWIVFGGAGGGIIVSAMVLLTTQALGPLPGSAEAEAIRLLVDDVTAAGLVFSGRLGDWSVDPSLIADPLTIPMVFIAAIAVLLRRTPGTLLTSALAGTVILIAFNPLVAPLVGSLLSDFLGLGLLLRVLWLLPVPYAIPALAAAYEGRFRVHRHWGPIIAVGLVVAMALPAAPQSLRDWSERRDQGWREQDGAVAAMGAIAVRSAVDDVMLPPKTIEFRAPGYDPEVKLLAYRGPVGTIPHFPRGRVDEGVARTAAVAAFFDRNHEPWLTAGDLDTLRRYRVRFLVLSSVDPRTREVLGSGWLELISNDGVWAAFRIDTQLIPPWRPGGR